MFTGIVQSQARVVGLERRAGLHTALLEFAPGFCADLAIGASVACDGVCLTVARILSPVQAQFDIMQPTLERTTLGNLELGALLCVERAAKEGAEVGGHVLSGHVDFAAPLLAIEKGEHNYKMRFGLERRFSPYVFERGYIAVNGASLTVARLQKSQDTDVGNAGHDAWFEVWLVPETRRVTTLEAKRVGDLVNIEIERSTQVIVDTLRSVLKETLNDTFSATLKDVLQKP